MREIKPCPICNGKNLFNFSHSDASGKDDMTACNDCGCQAPIDQWENRPIKAWQEAQAGEYIKQAVYNGYSLKSDKPPLSALDEEKLKDILKEHLTLLYETYEQCERDYNSCAKAICSKFGTPPKELGKVGFEKIAEIIVKKCTLARIDIAPQGMELINKISKSIVEYLRKEV